MLDPSGATSAYLVAFLSGMLGMISGATVAVISARFQMTGKEREAVWSWFDDTYIAGGINPVLDAVWELKAFGMLRPRNPEQDVQLPLDAVYRLETLIRTKSLSFLVTRIHPQWRDEISKHDNIVYDRVIGELEDVLVDLRRLLLRIKLRNRGDASRGTCQ